ncbi:hypothetical protein SUGI_0451680 [Cryptomeria japonica]|nr:hypothetical protein SUGI_0451680 [Cryptomeria japonica]
MEQLKCPKCEADVRPSGECECMEALSIEFSDYFRVYKDELKEVMKLCTGTGVPNPSELLQQNVSANVLRNRASEAYRKDLHRRISHIDYFTNGVAITVTCLFVGRYLAQFSNSNAEQSRNRRAIPAEDSNSYILPVRVMFWGLESINNRTIQIVGDNLNWEKIWQDVESNTAVLVFRIYDIQDYGEDDLWIDGSAVQIRGNPPAAKTAIKNLKTKVLVKGREYLCSVCQEKMVEGETMKKMPCKHEYHEECIDKWLAFSNFCPLCKHELPTDDPDYEQTKKQRRS